MQKIEELEFYLRYLLIQPIKDIGSIVHHSINLGRELQEFENDIRKPIGDLPFFTREFNYICECEICARGRIYSDICYLLADYIFLMVRDHIEEFGSFTISAVPDTPTSVISPSCAERNGIEIESVTQCKQPNLLEIFFTYTGKIQTEFALRDLPVKFSAIFDVHSCSSWKSFGSPSEFIQCLKDIVFLDEYDLTETTSEVLQCLFESLPKHFEPVE